MSIVITQIIRIYTTKHILKIDDDNVWNKIENRMVRAVIVNNIISIECGARNKPVKTFNAKYYISMRVRANANYKLRYRLYRHARVLYESLRFALCVAGFAVEVI